MSAAPPGVLDEINALFSWNPPPLVPAPGKKTSTSSRLPGFYDKHFSDKLVLKRVERLPSLVQDLASNVDKALNVALPTLPPLGPGFITAERRKCDRRELVTEAENEKAIANFYDQNTAKYCSSVASTLALHPTASSSEWSSLLFWTQAISPSCYAIMDGELRFKPAVGVEEEVRLLRAAILETMGDDIRPIFEEMRDSGSGLATWEIKGLGAGPGEVMSAVLNLGTFSWTTCTATSCRKILKHRKELERVAKVAVVHDAQDPPWSLPSAGEAGPSTLSPPPPSPGYGPLFSLSPITSDDEEPAPTKDKGKKRQRDDGSPARDNGKKHKCDDDEKEEEHWEEEEEAYQGRHDVTAQNLVQQAWAQATRVDGTVIVLHSGNHELVCVRHRASQTLYVSAVIEPHRCVDPGYGKLHVSIYVAAIQDVMDRKQQQSLSVSQPRPFGGGGLISGNKDQGNNRGSGSQRKGDPGHRGGKPKSGHGVEKGGELQGSAGGKGPTYDELAIEKMIHEISNRDVVLVYLQYGVYDSPIPASFLRSASSLTAQKRYPTHPFSPRTIRAYRPEECLTIVLTSEIGRGATGVVHRGIVKPEWDDAIPMDVVVKLAFDMQQRDALRKEYEIYCHFWLKGVRRGIATTLGFFDDSEDGACALVMLYAGVPLSTDPRSNLSVSDYESALSTMKSIHCAGILHGDIRLENILINDLGVTIIDFGHSKQSDSKRAKDKELAQLRYFLGLAGESR